MRQSVFFVAFLAAKAPFYGLCPNPQAFEKVGSADIQYRPCHPERQSKSEPSEDQIMRSIIWDLGRKRWLFMGDPATRPPLGRVRLRKWHTVSFSPLRMTSSTVVPYKFDASGKLISSRKIIKFYFITVERRHYDKKIVPKFQSSWRLGDYFLP